MGGPGARLLGSKWLRVVTGLLLGIAFLYLSLRGVSWNEIKIEFQGIAYQWIAFSLFVYWVELGVRILRWRTILSHAEPGMHAEHVGIAYLSGVAANNVLPAKLGEVFRADLLGRLARYSRLTVFGSIIIERMFDMVIVLSITAWGVFVLTTAHLEILQNINSALLALCVPVVGLVVGVITLVKFRDHPIVGRMEALSTKLKNLVHGLGALKHPGSYLHIAVLTLVIWALNTLAVWAILMSLDVNLSINHALLLIGITGISAAIPAAPAGIGTLQYAFHLTALLVGFSVSVAVLAATIVQVALLGSATAVGAIVYSYAISTHLLKPAEAQQ